MTNDLDLDSLGTALHGAAFASLPDRAFLRITGADAARWLNGMATNGAQALGPGEGCYTFFLNAQGRIQADGLLYREPGLSGETGFLLATTGAQIDALQTHLDRFIIMDDVELAPALAEEQSLLLLGPAAAETLSSLALPSLEPLRLAHADAPHGPVLVTTPFRAPHQVPRFELRAPAATALALRQQLEEAGLRQVGPGTLEQLRLLEGTPEVGRDIRDRELPQETGQMQALHFSKGCYLGQEIVERIRSRGQVNRLFTPLQLQGELPLLPATLEWDNKPIGEITSAMEVPAAAGSTLLALGYVRREALAALGPAGAPGDNQRPSLTYGGGQAWPRTLVP